jgi:DNA-directed RNA polymerase specialized sigma24 family protein
VIAHDLGLLRRADSNAPVLKPGELSWLLRKARRLGDKASQDKVVLAYTPLAISMARQRLPADGSVELDDLVQDALVGLLESAAYCTCWELDDFNAATFHACAKDWIDSHVHNAVVTAAQDAAHRAPLRAAHRVHARCPSDTRRLYAVL